VERLLLLWDELDELLGYGRHLAVGLSHSIVSRTRVPGGSAGLAAGVTATAETGHHRTLHP
jgi:hypothetical protein